MNPQYPKIYCIKWMKLAHRYFLNFAYALSLFRYYLSSQTDMALHLNIFESPLPKDAL